MHTVTKKVSYRIIKYNRDVSGRGQVPRVKRSGNNTGITDTVSAITSTTEAKALK